MDLHNHVINIFGPSTAGKTTITQMIQEANEGIYTVDFDIIKRQLAGYYWKRDSTVAQTISRDTLTSVLAEGLSVILLMPVPADEETYKRIEEIAQSYKYTLVNVELTAPEQVLINRYKERLRQIKESGSTWKFKTLDEFVDKLHQPYFQPKDTHCFDSSKLSPSQIINALQDALIT